MSIMNETELKPPRDGSSVPVATELQSTAEAALRGSPYRELQALRCLEQAGALTIQGAVSSFFLKQQAQETVRQLAGTSRVQNLIHVL